LTLHLGSREIITGDPLFLFVPNEEGFRACATLEGCGSLSPVKCFKHPQNDAVGVCAYCGRALCPECTQVTSAPRLACSGQCAEAVLRSEKALETLLQQGVRNARASAFYCYLCGGLSAAAAVVAWFMLPSPFLMLFTTGCAVVLGLSGVWYGRAARRQTQ
jgi:hypothetical protein